MDLPGLNSQEHSLLVHCYSNEYLHRVPPGCDEDEVRELMDCLSGQASV